MADIYEQHRAAFGRVAAYVILDKRGAGDGSPHVATISFRLPRDGAGRLYAYVHWLGTEMARGYAGGGGYDKRSAACAAASTKLVAPAEWVPAEKAYRPVPGSTEHGRWLAFRAALSHDDGHSWERRLRDAGFVVLQAV